MNHTTTKHTPGRWIVNVWTTGRRTIETEGGLVIAEVHRVHVDEEQKGNARLIAAAPDLLERLRELIAEVKGYDLNGCDHPAGICNCSMRIIVKQCEATIKAAEGE